MLIHPCMNKENPSKEHKSFPPSLIINIIFKMWQHKNVIKKECFALPWNFPWHVELWQKHKGRRICQIEVAKRKKSLYNQIIGTHRTSAKTHSNNRNNNSNDQCYRKGNQTQMLPCGWPCKTREQKTAIYQTHSKSIHQFSIATFPALTVVRGARAYPSRLGAKARVVSWSQDHVDTNDYTHSRRGNKLLLLVRPTCVSPLQEEVGIPGENPHRLTKNMQTPQAPWLPSSGSQVHHCTYILKMHCFTLIKFYPRKLSIAHLNPQISV